jgi:hypothetical protein
MPPIGPLWDAGNSVALAADCERMTSNSEVIPGQKSASRKSPLISSKPVSGQLPSSRPTGRNRADAVPRPSHFLGGSIMWDGSWFH